MPEGDAVLRTARRLHRALAGRVLDVAEIRWGTVDSSGLAGATTLEVVPVGKHLLHRVDTGITLHTHLRMEGRWRTLARADLTVAQRRSTRLRVLLATERQVALGFQLGLVEVLPTSEEHTTVGHLGPDLLGASWDEDLAIANLLARPDRPIAEALLDQRNLAGLGTIFTSEPLFMQRLHPWLSVGELTPDQLRALLRRARGLLQASVVTGTPVSTGDPREPAYVFGRSGRPCRRCGGPVRIAQVGQAPAERVLCYCPTCQGGLAPTDDGRRQRPLGASSGGGNDRRGRQRRDR